MRVEYKSLLGTPWRIVDHDQRRMGRSIFPFILFTLVVSTEIPINFALAGSAIISARRTEYRDVVSYVNIALIGWEPEFLKF